MGLHNQALVERWLLAATRSLHAPAYRAFWAHTVHGGSAGVGILIRGDQLRDDGLCLVGSDGSVQRGADGRLVAVRVKWAGHAFLLANVYFPASGGSPARVDFLQSVLSPVLSAHQGPVVMGGDFNFVDNVPFDRYRGVVGVYHPDNTTMRAFVAACPQLRDVFRAKHPRVRQFTYLQAGAASRLDRWYCPESMLPHVEHCAACSTGVADHRPVILHLRPAVPLRPARADLPRVRLSFMSSPDLVAIMKEWVEVQASFAPLSDPHALLVWWPKFKQGLAALAHRLNRVARGLSRQQCALQIQAKSLLQAAERSFDGAPSDAALGAVLAARMNYVAAGRPACEDAARRDRYEWLHAGERASPLITRLTQPPLMSRSIVALRSRDGGLLTAPHAMAEAMAATHAAISAPSNIDDSEQRAVLDAVAAIAKRFPAEAASSMGVADISAEELGAALQSVPSGRSPGPDGLPSEIYKRFRRQMLPLLTSVFSAIGKLGHVPAGFLLGAISPIYKRNDVTLPANYRPIALLNTDYRLLSRVLVARIGQPMAQVVGMEQSAFLPGRCIGDSVLFLQSLPALLARQGASAVMAFLDFEKAYDTVSRAFLFKVMEVMGVGAGWLRWVSALLTDTRTMAVVNGAASRPVIYHEGVRQGCPLSPCLYLFVGVALQCWLQQCAVGILVGSSFVAASHYADDTVPLLPSLDAPVITRFVSIMKRFQLASGQGLNVAKSQLLPVGSVTAPLPSSVAGMSVVSSAVALGVTITSAGVGPSDAELDAMWQPRMDAVFSCFGRIQKLGLSVFGRAFAASSYGVSKVLYHAEYEGLPPKHFLDRLHSITLALVDRDVPPGSSVRRLPGIQSDMLMGTVKDGGFGLLPWQRHMLARHAKWGAVLACHLLASADVSAAHLPLWVRVVGALVHNVRGRRPVHAGLMFLMDSTRGAPWHGVGVALQRLSRGLFELSVAFGDVGDVGEAPLPPPGAWCAGMPLWCNPVLVPRGFSAHDGKLLEGVGRVGFLTAIPSLWSLADFVRIMGVLNRAPVVGHAAYMAAVWDPELLSLGLTIMPADMRALVSDRQRVVEIMRELQGALPAGWLAAAHASVRGLPGAGLPVAMDTVVSEMIVPRLGWIPRRQGPRSVALSALSVRVATSMQLGEVVAARLGLHRAYIVAALGMVPPAVVPDARLIDLRARLHDCWHLRWENAHKETLFRLVVDGMPGSRVDAMRPKQCPCGVVPAAARHHAFWECPVAIAVRAAISTGLPAGSGVLLREGLWLLQSPPRVHPGVWSVVCMSALTAMAHGARFLWATHGNQQRVAASAAPPSGQATLFQAWGLQPPAPQVAPGRALVDIAAGRALMRFWEEIQDFASLDIIPPSWGDNLSQNTSFLSVDGQGRLIVVGAPA
jgi:exonuclease III